ncbi:MAG: Rieske (2Fe-2S) protein [Desulfobulbaceae bacterium]|nr:MAG: Rieske (2Fe-2S) protein [Desulfobulbaceae bacterium]
MKPIAYKKKRSERRSILLIGCILLFYPVYQFLSHRIPKKPERIELPFNPTSTTFLIQDRFIVFSNPTKTWALSRKCTHLGCKLNYREKEDYLECPCHQSRFSTSGKVLRGPADKQLKHYKVTRNLDKESITVIIT